MIETDYQGIYSIISDTLPIGWSKVVVHCIIWSGSCEIEYYVRTQHDSFLDCFSLGVPEDVLMNRIVNLIALIRKSQPKWNALTLTISSDGTFEADADYKSNINDPESYMKNWTYKYLK